MGTIVPTIHVRSGKILVFCQGLGLHMQQDLGVSIRVHINGCNVETAAKSSVLIVEATASKGNADGKESPEYRKLLESKCATSARQGARMWLCL
jgi:hypothetical protein